MSSGSLFTTVPKKSGSGGKSNLAQDATNLLVLKYLNNGRTVKTHTFQCHLLDILFFIRCVD